MERATSTIQDIMQQLAAPIAYQWRVKSFSPKGKAGSLAPGTKGQFLAYIDARDVFDRLDSVVGADKWSDSWEVIDPARQVVKVTLKVEIDGTIVTKSDVGYPNSDLDDEPYKSAVSDGIKRAAVHFGIGRFLYSMDAIWVEVDKWGKPLKPLPGTAVPSATARTTAPTPAPASQTSRQPDRTTASQISTVTATQYTCERCDETIPAAAMQKSQERYDGHTFCFKHQMEYKKGQLQAKNRTPVAPAPAQATPGKGDLPCEIPECTEVVWRSKEADNRHYHDGHIICYQHSTDKQTPWKSLHPAYQASSGLSDEEEDALVDAALEELGAVESPTYTTLPDGSVEKA